MILHFIARMVKLFRGTHRARLPSRSQTKAGSLRAVTAETLKNPNKTAHFTPKPILVAPVKT